MSYTFYIVSKSVLYALYSVRKCLINSLSVLFEVFASKRVSQGKFVGLVPAALQMVVDRKNIARKLIFNLYFKTKLF